jgi:replicative DNA helicase
MMGADPIAELARYVLGWILRNAVTSFTRREVYMPLRARFKQPAELDPPLDLLIEHDIIRRRPDPLRSGRGRAPSPTFDVNPQIHSQKSQNSESGPPAGISVISVRDFRAEAPNSASLPEDHENA